MMKISGIDSIFQIRVTCIMLILDDLNNLQYQLFHFLEIFSIIS